MNLKPILRTSLLAFFVGLLFLGSAQKAQATHAMGADITYRLIDTLVYEFQVVVYRDCRGIPISAPKTTLRCLNGSGTSYSRTLTRKSMKDISNVCASRSNPCSPPNSRSGKGIEAHLFLDTVDFSKAPFDSLLKCSSNGQVRYELSQCCRNGAINTGPANNNFYTFAMLTPGIDEGNSSPQFMSRPSPFICCNVAIRYNIGAVDSVERDSLSFAWAHPLRAWGNNIAYTSPYAYNKPFKVYDPYNNGLANPNVDPPIGLYLDPQTGQIIFTPTKCNEVSIAVVEIKEWRKDSTGTYKHIGTTRRDMQFWVETCPSNNAPTISGPFEHSVCVGDTLRFTITTKDKPKVLPGQPAPPADTTRLSWNEGIPEASFVLSPDTNLNQSAVFSWAPSISAVRSLPYTFTARVQDDNCPIRAESVRAFSITVKSRAEAKRKITALNCNRYEVLSDSIKWISGTAKYRWDLLDSNGQIVTNRAKAFFMSSGSFLSTNKRDTIQFFEKGRYIVKHTIGAYGDNCPTVYFDTLVVGYQNFIELDLGNDTFACANAKHGINPIIKTQEKIAKYRWSTSDTTPVLHYPVPGGLVSSLVELRISDSSGCYEALDSVRIYKRDPLYLELSREDTICPGSSTVYRLKDSIPYWIHPNDTSKTPVPQISKIYRSWVFKGKEISTSDSAIVSEAGRYWVTVDDSLGCASTLPINLYNNDTFSAKMSGDTAYCHLDRTNLKARVIKPKPGQTVRYEWSFIEPGKSRRYAGSDTVSNQYARVSAMYFLEVRVEQNGLSCTQTDSLWVSVYAKPTARIRTEWLENSQTPNHTPPPYLYCETHSDRTLGGLPTGGTWFTNGLNGVIGNQNTGYKFSPKVATKDTIFNLNYILKGQAHCTDTASVEVLVEARPAITRTGDTLYSTPAKSYQWYDSMGAITGETFATLWVQQTGPYYVVVQKDCGEMSSDTIDVIIGSSSLFRTENIQIYPNPAHKFVQIKNPHEKDVAICLFDLSGKCVVESKSNRNTIELNVAELSRGVYWIMLEVDGKKGYEKLILD